MTRAYRTARAHALSLSELTLLDLLRQEGELCESALAQALGVTLPAVSMAVRKLLSRGFVTLRPALHDSRKRMARVTQAGMALIREAKGGESNG